MGAISGAARQSHYTTINPVTGLAGDYLNHFHEIYLILRYVTDDPALIEDMQNWSPKTYVSHFEQSPLLDRADVIAAYAAVPPITRSRFDSLCEEAGRVIAIGLQALIAASANGGAANIAPAAEALADEVKSYLDQLDAIIHARSTPIRSIDQLKSALASSGR